MCLQLQSEAADYFTTAEQYLLSTTMSVAYHGDHCLSHTHGSRKGIDK